MKTIPVTSALLKELSQIRNETNSTIAAKACIEAQKGFGPTESLLESLRQELACQNKLKFIAQNYQINYRVQLDGDQEQQQMFSTLVENLYGIVPVDTYSGQIIEFPNKTKFLKFLKWREIFEQCAPNKKFKFIEFARESIKRVKQIEANNIIEIESKYTK